MMNILEIYAWFKKPFIVFILLISISCAGGIVEPNRGVTNQFFRQSDGEFIDIDKYDFSRLERGYGLLIFSYEINAERGNRILGWTDDSRRGIRVWEHKFSDNEWEIKREKKKMLFWGYRNLETLFLLRTGFKYSLVAEFHRGRIVYGGRLIIEQTQYFKDGPSVEFHFDEDMARWLNQYSDKIADIKIDTAIMQAGY